MTVSATATRTHFKVGDRVRFVLGARRVTGTIVEDRGPIGRDGRQLVRVEVKLGPTYLREFELPAALLTAA